MIKFNKLTTYAMMMTLACSGIAFAMEDGNDVRTTPPAVKKADVPGTEKVVREIARLNVQAETEVHTAKKNFKSYKAKFKKKAKSKKI